jgi:hypothetical protein
MSDGLNSVIDVLCAEILGWEDDVKVRELSILLWSVIPDMLNESGEYCCFWLQVEEVYTGPHGILGSANAIRPSLLIDASTIDPLTCRTLATKVAKCTLSTHSSTYSGSPINQCAVKTYAGIIYW